MDFFAGDIGLQSAFEVLRRLSCHGGSQLTAYGIRHIASCIVYDILCIVCDSTIFCSIGDIKCSLQLRGLIGAIGDRLFGRIQVVQHLIHFGTIGQLLSRCIGYIIGNIGIDTIGHRCLKATFLLGHTGIGGFSFADDRGDFIALLCHFGFASIRLYVAHDGIDTLFEGRAFSISTRNGIRDAFAVQHAGIIAHLVGQLRIRFVGDVLRFVRNIAGHGRGLVSADGVYLIPIELVCLLASDVDVLIPSDSMIFRTSDIGIKSAVEVLRRLSCHGGSQLTAYGIRHIASCIVYDILCIVCDSTIFCSIGDIKCSLQLRGLIGAIGDRLFGRIQVVQHLIHFGTIGQLLSRCIGYIIGNIGIDTIGHRCLKATFLLGHTGIGGFSFADDRGDFIALLCHFGFASIRLYVAHDGIDTLFEGRAFSISTRNGIRDAFAVQHAGIIAHLVGQLRIRFVGDVLRFVRNVAGHGRGLVSADGVFLIPIDLVGLLASDMEVLIPCHICFLTVAIVLCHLTSHILGLVASDFVQLIASDGGREIAAYGIRHIAAGVVHDILGIVCDRALFSGIGDIELILLCRGLTVFTLDGFIISLCRIDGTIGILTIFIFQIGLVFAGGLARIGAISLRIFGFGLDTICCHIRTGFCPVRAVPVFGIIDSPFFIVGELALGGMAVLCHFSQIRNPIRCDGGSTIMLFTGCFQLIIFQVDLAYIELAIDRQVFLYGDIFLKFCFAFRGQCAIERGIAGDTELAVNLGILEISIARSELAVYGSRFQLRIPSHGQTFIHLYRFLECRLSSGGERTIDLRIFEISLIRNSQLAIHLCTFQRGIAAGHGQTFIHIYRFIEIRVSVYRHRVRRIRAEDDVAFKVSIP